MNVSMLARVALRCPAGGPARVLPGG